MNKRNTIIILIVLLIWNIVLTVLFVNANNTSQIVTEENVYGISTDLTEVAQDSYSSVVSVKSSSGQQTGFIYKQDNNTAYIVTTFHGIGNENLVSVTFANNKTVPASIIGFDLLRDVAILSIDSPYTLNVTKAGDNDYAKNGEFVICIGSSNNIKSSNNVKLGIISNTIVNIKDQVTFQKTDYDVKKEMLALSLDVSEGFSGSPIFNMKGEVIGMVQMDDDELTYCLTINEIKTIADLAIDGKEVNKIELGIKGNYVKNMEDYERNMLNIPLEVINGYYIEEVEQHSLASKLELMPTDIIFSINNIQINTQKDFLNALYSNTSQEINLTVYRGDKTIDIKENLND